MSAAGDRRAVIEAFAGVDVSRESLARLAAYVDLLVRWQARMNLIGPASVDDIWLRHIADALQLIPLVGGDPGPLIDLGSGAGIPGLPLAIAWPQAPLIFAHLVESSGKKAAFLREAIRITGAPAMVHQRRIESLVAEEIRPRPRLVVARALAPLARLLELAAPFIEGGAIGLFHKGRNVGDELTESTKYWRISHRLHVSRLPGGGSILEIREIRRVAIP